MIHMTAMKFLVGGGGRVIVDFQRNRDGLGSWAEAANHSDLKRSEWTRGEGIVNLPRFLQHVVAV